MLRTDLTEDQQESLLNFQAITDNSDVSTALRFLEQNQWDVSNAVNDFFAFSSQQDFIQPPQVPDIPDIPPMRDSPPRMERLQEPQHYENLSVPGMIASQVSNIGSNIANGVKKVWSKYAPSFLTKNQESHSASSFVENLQNIVGTDATLPCFSTDQFDEILDQWFTNQQPLLIYINAETVPQRFIQEVICNDIIVSILNANFILWGVDGNSPEGKLAVEQLGIRRLPCIAIIAVVTQRQPYVIEMCDGHPTIEDLTEFIERNLNHFAYLKESPDHLAQPQAQVRRPPARPVDPQIAQDRMLREQQEREFREMEQQMAEIERQKAEEEAAAKAKADEEARIAEEKLAEKERKRQSLPTEAEPGPDATKVVFRLPTGAKIERRFGKVETVQNLYTFLSLDNFEDDSSITLSTTYPTKELTDRDVSLEESGLHPQALIHVRENLD